MVKELEVKILRIDLDSMEEKILSLKGELIADEVQINTLIDSTKNPIKDKLDAYLRIRETENLLEDKKNVVLTLKKNIKNKDLRENIELNTEIEDKETMLKILESLGFDKIELGHKKRRSYKLEGARIDLDTWDKKTYPYPYMEIEVKDVEHLNKLIELLDIQKENISSKSIVELRKELNLI